MSQTVSNKQDHAALMKKALVELRETKAKLQYLEDAKTEPIAIIGMGCRFPGGADNPETFWNLLSQGKDAIAEVPLDRWNLDDYYDPNRETPGKMYTRYGGFVKHLQEFDSNFFGISPREARALDPQHRLLLEVSWEAIENAALNPQQLAKTQTGVFIGICSSDYSQLLCRREPTEINSYFGSGNSHSSASGRLSYILGLTGPSLAVDTACSSSLVTLHLACLSLRNRESDLAIAGGVNRIITPEVTINFSKARMLSADGRCKTFDASADGFVRSEGCGIVVLKRLSDAIADGDNILAVIRGSAVNQDGHTSGLTVPNGPSQQAVIHKALENGGVDPNQVSYIEAHGTGTSLGDPIELGAIGAVFGKVHSQQQPLIVGSVKTNFGHLEGAAGIAGLMKVVLQLQHQMIAPHLHFHKPNPYINWEELPVVVPAQATPWQVTGERRRIAGVSSFSFSGTNAHVVLEEAPIQAKTPINNKNIQERPLHLLTLSAKTPQALEQLVKCYQQYLQSNPELGIADICYTANTGRAHFNHRLAVIVGDQKELAEKLRSVTAHIEEAGVVRQQLPNSTSIPKVAFLFTGQGSQQINMGRQLYETQPVFRQALDQCNEILSSYLEKPLLTVLYPQQSAQSFPSTGAQHKSGQILDETAYTQPALFAIEYALFQLWKSWGIKPDVVMGHSVGEYVAACVAGIFSLSDGLKLTASRGRLMQLLPTGEMVAVMASESQVQPLLDPYADSVALAKPTVGIAAINGPNSVVISGTTETIRAICNILSGQGVKTTPLKVSHAFHSPLMEPMLAEFEAVASQVTYNRPKIPLISNVTGQRADDTITTPQYWVNHVRQPVRFADSIQTLHEQGYEVFLEIGAKPILLGMGRQCLPEDVGIWLPSLRPQQTDWQQMLQSLGQLYVHGVTVDWSGFDRDYFRHKVVLPTYPFERKRYWVETADNRYQKVEPPSQENGLTPTSACVKSQLEYQISPQQITPSTIDVAPVATKINGQALKKAQEKIVCQQLEVMAQQLEVLRVKQKWQIPQSSSMVTTNKSSIVQPQVFSSVSSSQTNNSTTVPARIAYYKPRPNARLRLFCFHELGGSAYIFREWSDSLPSEFEVCPVELPGREGDLKEQPFTHFSALIQPLAQVLTPYLDKPFAFWGQSLGAFIGFELAHLLRQQYGLKPIHFFIGGAWAPHSLLSQLKTMSSLSQEEILNRFLELLEVPQSRQTNEAVMEIILSRLKADIQLLLSYRQLYSQGDPLDCPISVFGGLQDTEATQDELSQWSQYTLKSFKLQMVPGTHGSFLSDNQTFIFDKISSKLIV